MERKGRAKEREQTGILEGCFSLGRWAGKVMGVINLRNAIIQSLRTTTLHLY